MNVSKQLIQHAVTARQKAYAPYSNFTVGSAVETQSGEVFSGCNVENASIGLTICAERNALAAAVAAGHRDFKQIVVASNSGVMPCGACRQVIWELCGDIPIILVDEDGHTAQTTSQKLLPSAFSPNDLSE